MRFPIMANFVLTVSLVTLVACSGVNQETVTSSEEESEQVTKVLDGENPSLEPSEVSTVLPTNTSIPNTP
jgi:hypothetical protein